jgi:hypothetical protein
MDGNPAEERCGFAIVRSGGKLRCAAPAGHNSGLGAPDHDKAPLIEGTCNRPLARLTAELAIRSESMSEEALAA